MEKSLMNLSLSELLAIKKSIDNGYLDGVNSDNLSYKSSNTSRDMDEWNERCLLLHPIEKAIKEKTLYYLDNFN